MEIMYISKYILETNAMLKPALKLKKYEKGLRCNLCECFYFVFILHSVQIFHASHNRRCSINSLEKTCLRKSSTSVGLSRSLSFKKNKKAYGNSSFLNLTNTVI